MRTAPAVPAPAQESTRPGPGLHITGLRKWYGDTRALEGLGLIARPGEILGIAGPNGAGKSTLIKILAGETVQDAGEVILDGAPWRPLLGHERVAVVHQEPQLFPNLTVAENLMVGREATRALRRRLTNAERELLRDLGILAFADRPLHAVPLAIQQRVEIGRALAREARVFLFDEPNSALTKEESTDLFVRMRALADGDRVVLLVSHRIAELVEHTDRVALILDGRCVQQLVGADLTQENVASALVVGQTHSAQDQDRGFLEDGATVLRLKEWAHPGGDFIDIHLHIRAGTIVALMGVEGSGARELVRSMAGFESAHGEAEIAGRHGASEIAGRSSFVAADRQVSLFGHLSIGDNMVARLDDEITAVAGTLRRGRMAKIAHRLREQFRVKTPSIHLPVTSLSGGNQQKVAIAAAIIERPQLLVLEEPTRGVDLTSKAEIYRLMREYARAGHAVVIYCTEVPEAFQAADIVYVVSDGRLSEPLYVQTFDDVESLARAVTRLERHAVLPAAVTAAAAGA
jgi:ABC-type sugar transport system ATPase subunit